MIIEKYDFKFQDSELNKEYILVLQICRVFLSVINFSQSVLGKLVIISD